MSELMSSSDGSFSSPRSQILLSQEKNPLPTITECEQYEDSPPIEESSPRDPLVCERCNTSFKSLRSLKIHKAHHLRKDSAQKIDKEAMVLSSVHTAVDVLKEMLNEPIVGLMENEYFAVLIFLCELDSPSHKLDWNLFVDCVSRKILEFILKSTRLIPKNRYAEMLTKVNHYLCDEGERTKLLNMLSKVVSAERVILSRIIYRFSFKMFQHLQIDAISKMKKQPTQQFQADVAARELSLTEKQSLYFAVGSVLRRIVYKSTVYPENTVLRARCKCITERCMFSNDVDYSDEFYKIKEWFDKLDRGGLIAVNEAAFDFFLSIEMIIMSLNKNTSDQFDFQKLLIEVYHVKNDSLLNLWNFFTMNIISEADSIMFLEDLLKRYVDFSMRAEVDKRMRLFGEDAQNVALRTDLKRN